jgi:CelD/BcsL family acetyltransferase involved in cellulose biosynthesis
MRLSKAYRPAAPLKVEAYPFSRWKEERERWRAFSFFQTPEWVEAFCLAFDQLENGSVLLSHPEGKEILLPVVENRKAPGLYTWLSLPYGCYGGPILPRQAASAGEIASWPMVSDFLARQGFSAINITMPPGTNPPEWKNYRARTLTTQVLELERDFEALAESRFSSACRRAIRKAERDRIEARSLGKDECREEFLNLYRQSLERWNESEGFPEKLFDLLRALPGVDVWGAFYQGELVSAALLLTHENHRYYWLGAMDEKTQHLRPNNLLFHEILKASCAEGVKSFDFGNSDGLIGVFNFKKSFGPKLISYHQLYDAGPLARGYRRLRALLRGQAERS